ncbi:two-component response regulator [Providencia sneebia DSM 19967]|uniref:Two-component response regulator n=2 Tax=Providencia sneebia TaxID=516075 RepID=K8WHL5_9GAMM|nr:hypothetical protein [Providencia sneebia]EKT60073.1 two-component response regulator [Providencia sneebia DSM 19967]
MGLQHNEIIPLLAGSKQKIMSVINKLILVIKYQQAKLTNRHQDWMLYRSKMSKHDFLFADAAQFVEIPEGFSEKELAIKLLFNVDSRKAIVWALRLNIKLPDGSIIMKRPECINFIVNKMIDN